MLPSTSYYNQTHITRLQPIKPIPILPIHSTITPIQQFQTINTIKIHNNVHSNNFNTINTLNQNLIPINLSTQLGIETQNAIIHAITKQLNNLQQIISTYTKTFTVPLQSLSNTMNNHSSIKNMSHATLWQQLSNDISNCIVIQNQMYKDIVTQKTFVDNQLNSILQTMSQLNQQKIVLIQTPQAINTINTNINNKLVNCRISVPVTNCQIKNKNTEISHHSNSGVTNQKTISENNKKNKPKTIVLNSNINVNVNKKKRKRRGYNGPYSIEEQNFMRNWQKNDTPQDILNMSIEMEHKFKVKRSPYGLAQKMYQLGIINSRLKAIFQRKLEKEGRQTKECSTYSCMSNDSNSTNSIPPSNLSMQSIDVSDTCDGSDNENKKRPFTIQEVNYIKNELIINYKNEQPRKLYWRFINKFTQWKNDNKSYQKFYHKYWILNNDSKRNVSKDVKKIESDCTNENVDRKRCMQFANIIVPPHKKLKLQMK